jgi:hypothetical protein
MILLGSSLGLADEASYGQATGDGARRSAYSYIRVTNGEVTVVSQYNGRVAASRNMPISTGDEISVSDAGRAEVALADGNLLEVGGATRLRFESLLDQQGEDDSVSSIRLLEGSVLIAAVSAHGGEIPRIDTEEATVYLNAGARIRVNEDPRRGTTVIARSGNAEVRTPQGSYRVHAGEFLVARGEEEPEIQRGAFSRDRFDIWAADRLEALSDSRNASARYVDSEYASDVAALDGYGDWNYSQEYQTDVWSPRVDAGWTPYSYGSWYPTPAGLTWWSSDPWGWYPFHYGNWFFSASWNRWCWGPASVYSPGWVYWGFSPGFVGWCPIGNYSYWSPWFDGYYRRLGFNRPGVSIAIQGTFPVRTVDFRGWNFVGARNLGAAVSRMDVIPGARIADRLGASQVAISSRPIVVSPRAGNIHEAMQSFLRDAPRTIERTAPADSARLAPILAHQRTLPESTIEAVKQRAVVADRGRLAGPGVADVAPRGALVERNRSLSEITARAPVAERGHANVAPGTPALRTPESQARSRADAARPGADWRTRSVESRERETVRTERPDARTIERARPEREAPSPSGDWRSRSRTSIAPESPRPSRSLETPRREAPSGDWKSRSRASTAPESLPSGRSLESPRRETWRSREELPPARRVIEGAVPGRRAPESSVDQAPRTRSWRETAPPPPAREYRSEPRPEYRAPRDSHPGPAPAPHIERAPAYSAPPPRAEPPRAEPRHSAPPPNRGRPDR